MYMNNKPVKSFGKEGAPNPKECGKKGGLSKGNSTKAIMLKQLKATQKLPYDQFMEEVRKINPSFAEPDLLSTILLSGEKGYDSFIQKLLETRANLASKEMGKTNSEKEQGIILDNLINRAGYVKTLLYGSKVRSESKTEIVGEVWDAKNEFGKWLNDAKEELRTESDTKKPKQEMV